MTPLVARRARNVVILAVASTLLLLWYAGRTPPLDAPERTTGWLLGAAVLFLALYNARKKIAVVPLGASAAWLQWHVYVGLFAILLFFVHAGPRAPTGTLETVLALLFLLVALSGVVGLYLSRRIPARLARRGEEVIYERIPRLVHEVAGRAERLALESVARTRSRAIADFHATELRAWLARPREGLAHVLRLGGPHRRRAHAMEEFRSCLGEAEMQVFDELAAIVRQKEDLDYHRANQGLLKYWFFAHLPLTYALLLFGALHALLVLAFGGGA
jgi:hypothetical protein